MGNVLTNYNDRWTPENPSEDVFYPRLSYKGRIRTTAEFDLVAA